MHYFWGKKFWVDYTSKYGFHSTDFCMHLYTSTHQFRLFCVCMLLHVVPYFLLNPIRIGRDFKAAPPKFCHHAFNPGATLLCVGDFSYKIVSHRAAKKF